MEYEITSREVRSAKRTLSVIAIVGALVCVFCAAIRVMLGSKIQEFSGALPGLLGLGIILGLFVALLAFNTRLQVDLDEKESLEHATLNNTEN
jgi:hypothetical protein